MYIITHSGKFHADELMACAILKCVFQVENITRTRFLPNFGQMVDRHILVDVGGVYDPALRMFDHHQKNAPKRPDGSSYSSCGLVWKHYGRDAIRSSRAPLTDLQITMIWEQIDAGIISAIDAVDSGEGSLEGYTFSAALGSFNVNNEELGEDLGFHDALVVAEQIIRNVIAETTARVFEADYVRSCPTVCGGKVLVLDRGVPWIETVLDEEKFSSVEFVMFPHIDGVTWRLQSVPSGRKDFGKRKDLPAEWAGLSGAELETVCGVMGAVFCHKALFICGASNRAAMLFMADLAAR